MTSRPRLATDVNYVNGLAALALFVVMAYVFMTSDVSAPAGFADGSIVASIGYAMFDMLDQGAVEAEGFLVAFIVIALVLDAALDGAVMLARREDDEQSVTALADGGFLSRTKETSSEHCSDGGSLLGRNDGEDAGSGDDGGDD